MTEQTRNVVELSPHHVGIRVRDMEASIEWYCDVLGFAVVARDWLDDVPYSITLLKHGAFYVELFRDKNTPPISKGPPGGIGEMLGIITLAFSLNDSDWQKLTEGLDRKGVDVRQRNPRGYARIIRDNSGNAIEFLTHEGLRRMIERGADRRAESRDDLRDLSRPS